MKNKTLILLLFVLAIAAFFRFWQLNSVPPGLYPDVAINGNDALDTLETKNFKVFYPENNGREGIFFWFIALSFAIFGPSVWAIKFTAAVFGFLTVLGTYFLAKEIFENIQKDTAKRIALFSTFFLAISFWHVNFSRIGFRAILAPFALVFAFYFLFRGFNQKKLAHFIISGIFFGFGAYTYISYRFVVFILAIILFCWWLIYKKQKLTKKFLKYALCCLLFALIVALPIGIYFLQQPQDFLGRAANVSVFKQDNGVLKLGASLIVHLTMFNFFGDVNWRHNFSGAPMLIWPVGFLFLVGIILSIKRLTILLKAKESEKILAYSLLFSWFFFMLASGFLSYEGIPHGLRVIGTIPAVFIFAGIGANWFFEKMRPFFKTKKQVIGFYLVGAIFFLSVGYVEFYKYFYQWGKNPEVKNAFSSDYLEIGKYLNMLPDNVKKYVIVNRSGVPVPFPDGLPMPAQVPIFLERSVYKNPRAIYLEPNQLDKIKIENETVIIPMGYDEALFLEISQRFPEGKIVKNNGLWQYRLK